MADQRESRGYTQYSEDNTQDAWLLRRIADEDDDALRELIARHGERKSRIAWRVLGTSASLEDVEEVLSDSFIRAWQTAGLYKPAFGSVSQWLSRIVFYESLGRRKRVLRKRRLDELLARMAEHNQRSDSHFGDEDLGVLQRFTIGQIVDAFRKTHPGDADLLVRRFILDEDINTIARRLNISSNATRVRVHRAIARMRAMLSPDNADDPNFK